MRETVRLMQSSSEIDCLQRKRKSQNENKNFGTTNWGFMQLKGTNIWASSSGNARYSTGICMPVSQVFWMLAILQSCSWGPQRKTNPTSTVLFQAEYENIYPHKIFNNPHSYFENEIDLKKYWVYSFFKAAFEECMVTSISGCVLFPPTKQLMWTTVQCVTVKGLYLWHKFNIIRLNRFE